MNSVFICVLTVHQNVIYKHHHKLARVLSKALCIRSIKATATLMKKPKGIIECSDRLNTYPRIFYNFSFHVISQKSIVSNSDTFLFLLDVLNIKCYGPQLISSLSALLCQAHIIDFEILVSHSHVLQIPVTFLSSNFT